MTPPQNETTVALNSQRFKINELQRLLTICWDRVVAHEDAKEIAVAIVRTALQKQVPEEILSDAVADIRMAMRRRSRLNETVRRGAIRGYNLGGMPGIAFMPLLTRKVVSLARNHGIGVISMTNSSAVDTLSTWLLSIPRDDCIGIFVWNGGSYTTVPFGSKEPFFGTNPISYAIPTSEEPLLLDMSTSQIPFVSLVAAIRNKRVLPNGCGLNKKGIPTSRPELIYDIVKDSDVRLLPMGGDYKGSAIMLFLEIITGALINAKMSREATSSESIPEEFGGILVAIDIKTFTSPAIFKRRVTKMAKLVRSSNKAYGFNEIRLPGDGSYRREAARRKAGIIRISESIATELIALSRRTVHGAKP